MMISVEMATADSITDSDSSGNNEFHAGGEAVGVGEAVAVGLVEAGPFLAVTESFSGDAKESVAGDNCIMVGKEGRL